MNILLVYPEFPDTFWSFKHALGFIRKRAASPPLGLLTVAALLPSAWPQRLVDLNVQALTQEHLAWADLVMVSAMAVQRSSAEDVIERCRRAGVRVVAGGPLFTTEPDQFPDVDHLILGEAELALPPFLADLERGVAQRTYRANGFPDLAASPAPRWELLDLQKYATMSIQYSRGCPYDCEFCSVTALLGHRPRTKNAEQIVVELDALYELGWRRGVFFVDDNLIGNRKHLESELLPALVRWRRDKRGMEFNTEASINLADDPGLMQAMVAAGFTVVFVGIETPDEQGLAECSKKHNLGRDMRADVERMQRAGLQVQGGFIVGFDSDTPSTFQRLTEFIQSAGIVTAMVGLLQAPPGTKLHARLERDGRLLEGHSGDNVNGSTNIIPVSADPEFLRGSYLATLSGLYAPRAYYERVRALLRQYKLPRIKQPMNLRYAWEQGVAFVLSVTRLGVLGRERAEYWRLLVWTLFRRPRALALAITLAIYGYHFRRVCELHVD